MTQPVVRALDVVDRLECDGRTLLLLEHRVVELNPLALAAYDAASEPAALDALTGTLVDRFGAPPDGDAGDLVRGVVDELLALGLVAES